MTDYVEVYRPVACLIRMRRFADRFYHNLMDRHQELFTLDHESAVLTELSAAFGEEITPNEADDLLVYAAVVATEFINRKETDDDEA